MEIRDLETRGPWAVASERSEDATKGPRVSKSRISMDSPYNLYVHVHAHCTCTCTLVYIRMCISSIIWCIFMYTYVWWEGVECTFQASCSLATGVPVHVYMVEVYRSNSILFQVYLFFPLPPFLPPSLPQSTVRCALHNMIIIPTCTCMQVCTAKVIIHSSPVVMIPLPLLPPCLLSSLSLRLQ